MKDEDWLKEDEGLVNSSKRMKATCLVNRLNGHLVNWWPTLYYGQGLSLNQVQCSIVCLPCACTYRTQDRRDLSGD